MTQGRINAAHGRSVVFARLRQCALYASLSQPTRHLDWFSRFGRSPAGPTHIYADHATCDMCTKTASTRVVRSTQPNILFELQLFHCSLKTFLFFQIIPTAAFLFFSWTDSTDSPDCLPILLSISVFFAFQFFSFLLFSLVQCGRLSWLMPK